jgi:acetone carboxylase gamma subunit
MRQYISEYLVIGDSFGEKMIQCGKCDYVFCPAAENYKNHVLCGEFPLKKAGPRYSDSERFILREFYCPKCGIKLDVETCLKGSPFIHDSRVKV